jgi:hypothetical protein
MEKTSRARTHAVGGRDPASSARSSASLRALRRRGRGAADPSGKTATGCYAGSAAATACRICFGSMKRTSSRSTSNSST